jgi:predicted glycosyltransferase
LIWIDIVNEANVRFWRRFLKKFRGRVFLTTRRKGSLVELLRAMIPIEAEVIGKWGASDYEKLVSFAERVKELALLIADREVDLAVSKASVEQARVAFGLGIPYIAMNDNDIPPHIVTKLTFPLSTLSIVPECFSGPTYSETMRFRGLFEVSHVLDFTEDGEFVKSDLGLDEGEYIVIRYPPVASHYLKEGGPFEIIVEKFLREKGIPAVKIMREGIIELPSGERVSASIDGISLISRSAGVISGGGTMAREAALLGVPSISLFPGEDPCVSKILLSEGLMRKATGMKARDLPSVYDELRKEWESGRLRERAREFLRGCEDPAEVLVRVIRSRFS